MNRQKKQSAFTLYLSTIRSNITSLIQDEYCSDLIPITVALDKQRVFSSTDSHDSFLMWAHGSVCELPLPIGPVSMSQQGYMFKHLHKTIHQPQPPYPPLFL